MLRTLITIIECKCFTNANCGFSRSKQMSLSRVGRSPVKGHSTDVHYKYSYDTDKNVHLFGHVV